MRLIGLYALGCFIFGFGLWLSVLAVSIMGGWIAGFAVGAFVTAWAAKTGLKHNSKQAFRETVEQL